MIEDDTLIHGAYKYNGCTYEIHEDEEDNLYALPWRDKFTYPENATKYLTAAVRAFNEEYKWTERIRSRPTFGEQEVLERAIERMGWKQIHAYEAEMRKGQDIYEDAGGFIIRGLACLFGVKPNKPTIQTYQDAARAMITDGHSSS